jgi:ABC-type sugar transport system substrate-binding protein
VADGLVGKQILTEGVAEADIRLLADAEHLRSLGLRKAIRLMGFDSSEPLLQAVATGEMDGLILQDPYKMGYLGVWTVVRYLQGDDVSAEPVSPYPGLTGNYLGTGEHVITRTNLRDRSTIELFNPAAQEQRTIATPRWPRRK